jgi:hypothetical protein
LPRDARRRRAGVPLERAALRRRPT